MGRIRVAFLLVIASSLQAGYLIRYFQADANSENMLLKASNDMMSELTKEADNPFRLAHHESDGFFQDIKAEDWSRLKQKVREIHPNTLTRLTPSQLRKRRINANVFFQDYFEPNFNCMHERRIGRRGDGGKWVCDPHRIDASYNNATGEASCLVYSVGSNGDVSFEDAVKKEIGSHCEIHSFDIANYSAKVEAVGAHFHQWGIAAEAKVNRKGVFKTLPQTIQELGHEGRTIDIFKIDCEGCEWSSFSSFFQANVTLRQILVELHAAPNRKDPKSKFQPMPMPETMDFFDSLMKHGYVIFHKEINIRFWHFGQCIEYAFLKLHPDFFDWMRG